MAAAISLPRRMQPPPPARPSHPAPPVCRASPTSPPPYRARSHRPPLPLRAAAPYPPCAVAPCPPRTPRRSLSRVAGHPRPRARPCPGRRRSRSRAAPRWSLAQTEDPPPRTTSMGGVAERKVKLAEVALRALLCGLAARAAATLVATDSQTKIFFSFEKKATFTDMKAMVFLVIANGVSAGYSLLLAARCCVAAARGSFLLSRALA